MIHIERKISSIQTDFNNKFAKQKKEIADLYYEINTSNSQKKYKIDLTEIKSYKPDLLKSFYNKCAFCETTLDTEKTNIVWFRPRSDAMNIDGSTDTIYYWWLTYEWENLYPSCHSCAKHKSSRFPVKGKRASIGDSGTKLFNEKRSLYDPCIDTEFSFQYEIDGTITAQSYKANITIEVFGLNRPQLVNDRRNIFVELKEIIKRFENLNKIPLGIRLKKETLQLEKVTKELENETDVKKSFSAFRKHIINAIKSGFSLQDLNSNTNEIKTNYSRFNHNSISQLKFISRSEAIWITRIEIVNFKSITNLSIEFQADISDEINEPWIMILGENGVGKSTILKAVALAFMDEKLTTTYFPNPEKLINSASRKKHSFIRIFFNNSEEPLQVRFGRGIDGFEISGNRQPISLLGYGSTRLLRQSNTTKEYHPKRINIENLLNPYAHLSNFEPWLSNTKRVKPSKFNKIAGSLLELLSLDDNSKIVRRSGKLFITHNKQLVPLVDLSDGYQSVIALATDIIFNLAHDWDDMSSAEGTVLLDEIELHLHPKWKIEIVSCLRRIFPRIRFIVTTHDPLCLHGLKENEIYKLFRDINTKTVNIFKTEIPKGIQIDQLLTGSWFGLSSTMDEDTRELYQEYLLLLRQSNDSDTQCERIEELRIIIHKRLGSFAETSIERFALGVASEVMLDNQGRIDYSNKKPHEIKNKIYKILKQTND